MQTFESKALGPGPGRRIAGRLRDPERSIDGVLRGASRALARLARRRGLAVALVGLLALAVGAALSLLVCRQVPSPLVHDEFGYLLTADTFAHGRLTNPTHPMWVHLESIHILHRPTYNGKYPVGQALFLAAGQLLCGLPLAGVWLSTALACGAICWMLMAWLPPRWALLGGLLAVVHPTIAFFWGQTYWGGSVAALGGSLVLGALARLLAGPRIREALVMGLGMAVLANSRPFEGLVLTLLALLVLAGVVVRHGPPARAWLGRFALPVALVLAPAAAAMALYNARVTGHPLRMPYMAYMADYAVAPNFLWQEPRPEPAYRHAEIRRFHTEWELRRYLSQTTVRGFLRQYWQKLTVFFWSALPMAHLGAWLPVLQVPLLALPWALRDRRMRLALALLAGFLASFLFSTWLFPHYAAPAIGLVFALELQAMRQLRLWRPAGRPVGRWLLRAVLVLYFAGFAANCVELSRYNPEGGLHERRRIEQALERAGGRHLVVVRYSPRHDVHEEWVYNGADIDGAPVVWAREGARSGQLLDYFPDRRVWLLEADAQPPRLTPYPSWGGP